MTADSTRGFIRKYRSGLLRYLSHLGARPEDAEEIASDVFVMVGPSSFRDRLAGDPLVYLRASGRNGYLTRRRDQRRGKRDERRNISLIEPTPGAPPLDFPSREKTPSEAAQANETADRVKKAIASLPELERQVVLLSRVESLTHAQIANRLGITIGQVRGRYADAVGKLQFLLRAEAE